MSATIPDLWSDDIRVDVLPPLVILRSQADLLASKTKGILESRVLTASEGTQDQHQLDLIAPALHHYRVTLLTARHAKDMVYPVKVRSQAFLPEHKPGALVVSKSGFGPPADQKEAATQDEFIALVREVLHSGYVRSLIQSLIARSYQGESDEDTAEISENGAPSPNPDDHDLGASGKD